MRPRLKLRLLITVWPYSVAYRPEPSASPVWNSRVKDAWRNACTNWSVRVGLICPQPSARLPLTGFAAYRKYFSTDKPLRLGLDRIRFFGALYASSRLPPRAAEGPDE